MGVLRPHRGSERPNSTRVYIVPSPYEHPCRCDVTGALQEERQRIPRHLEAPGRNSYRLTLHDSSILPERTAAGLSQELYFDEIDNPLYIESPAPLSGTADIQHYQMEKSIL